MLTAFQAMRFNSQVKAKDTVLIHAGAGVGTAACQLCRVFGATSITTSSSAKVPFCEKFADFAISREGGEKQFASKVLDLFQGKPQVDLVIDPVFGQGYLAENTEVLALDGKIVVLAFLGGPIIEHFDAMPLFRRRAEIKFSTLRSQSNEYKASLVAAFEKEVLPYFQANVEEQLRLRPVVTCVLPIEAVEKAHQMIEENTTTGKIVLTFD